MVARFETVIRYYLVVMVLALVACTYNTTEDDMHDGVSLNGNQQSASGGWGASGTLVTGGINEETGKAVSLQAEFPRAGNYTVQATLLLTGGPPDGTHPAPRADLLVNWSVEGHTIKRRVSIGQGISLTGVGQAVSIQAVDKTELFVGPPADESLEYTVVIQVAPGTRGSTALPPTLVEGGSSNGGVTPVNAGANIDFAVPQDAGVTSVFITAVPIGSPPVLPAAGLIQVIVEDAAGGALMVYDPRDFQFVALPPNATNINVRNYSLINSVEISMTFGIDG